MDLFQSPYRLVDRDQLSMLSDRMSVDEGKSGVDMRQVPPSTRSPDMVRRPISRLVWNNRHATQLCVPTRTRSLTGFPLVGEVDVCESPDLKADRSVCYEQSTKCPKLISRKTATRRHSPYLPPPSSSPVDLNPGNAPQRNCQPPLQA